MDYSKLSEDEIAVEVLIAQGYKLFTDGYGYSIFMSESERKDIGPKASKKFVFDPCNNAADAWPIILENGISLRKLHNGRWRSINEWGDSHQHNHDNPLRAAMVVFLMMQESGLWQEP